MLNLEEKIEEIRRQPDHIRLRWVWGSVLLSMLIIFIIWIFSINLMFKNSKNEVSPGTEDLVSELKDQTSQIKEQAKSLKATTEGISKTITTENTATLQEKANPKTQTTTEKTTTDLTPVAPPSQNTNLENSPQ